MFVGVALGELTHLLCCYVRDKNMQSLIVVEAGHAFTGVWLVEITRDDHGIAGGFRGLLARARKGTVGAVRRREKHDVGALRACDKKAGLVRDTPFECERLSVWRPQRATRGVL